MARAPRQTATPTTSPAATCATCPFAFAHAEHIICRFLPPTPVLVDGRLLPIRTTMSADDWCGQHPERRLLV